MMQYLRYLWSSKNYRMSISLAAIALLWLASGLLRPAPEASPEAVVEGDKRTSVQARYISAQDYAPTIRIRARTEARRKVSLRAELGGRVVELPVKEGQRVQQGDVLCRLALEDRKVRHQEALSTVAKAQLEFDGAQKLKSGGFQSRTAIASARANLDGARASLRRTEIDLANVEVRAPFAGLVERHSVEVGTFMTRGDECAVLLELDPLVISGQVSESEVGRLRAGSRASGQLLSGQQVEGLLTFVGSDADEVTRTFRVETEVDNASFLLRSGVSAELRVAVTPLSAHLVPSTLLALDDQGRLGIRILDADHVARFVNVELVGDHPDGVWVTGLPRQALLITVGQEYVTNGEAVEVTIEPTAVAAGPAP
jgi:multidrug efflux system membrane fusion protein